MKLRIKDKQRGRSRRRKKKNLDIKKLVIATVTACVAVTMTACQSSRRPAVETAGILTTETAVVENQLNTGILIAYLADTEGAAISEVQDGGGASGQMQPAVQLIEEVTGGTVYAIDTQADIPTDYGTIFLGFSSQSAELPSDLVDFMEQNDFSGKTIIPFVVMNREDSTGIIDALYEAEPESEFLEEFYISNEIYGDSPELRTGIGEWLSDLGYNN